MKRFLLIAVAASVAAAAHASRTLDALAEPSSWTGSPGKISVSKAHGCLDVSVSAVRSDGAFRVSLSEPVRLGEGENVIFDCCMSRICPMMMLVTARDAKGRELRFKTRSLATLPNGIGGWGCNLVGGVFRGGLDELGTVRVDVPGFSDPVRESYDPRGPVEPPFTMTGFEFLVEEEKSAGATELWLSNFHAARTSFKTDSFQAVFKDGQYFGEADAEIPLRLTDFGHVWGNRHEMSWSIRDAYDGEPFTNGVVKVEFADDDPRPYKLRFDEYLRLPFLPEGTYWVKAELKSGFDGKSFGFAKMLDLRYDVFRNDAAGGAARKTAQRRIEMPKAGEFTVPEGVPSADEILGGPDPLRIFCPMVREDIDEVETYVKLFDEMKKEGVADVVEIQNRWPRCEPAPGKYDFSNTRRILDEAHKRGIRCFVTFAPLVPPEWMPSIFTMNAEGNRFGHTMYLFHGGRFNLFFSRYARQCARAYLANLVLAVRDHPATLGYFYIAEHSCEAPWADWYEGFDPETLGAFRAAMKRRFADVSAANAAWGTTFASFDKVRPPAVGEKSSMAFRRDWLVWRRNTVHEFVVGCLGLARRLDPHRILMCYGDGLLSHRLGEVARLKCLSANGGCAVPSRLLAYSVWAESGVPMRTEEISCTQWSSFPYQLDRSFFTILSGGGASSHVKMFIPCGASFDSIRGGANDLARWEMFLPLWKEVRGAKAVYGDVRAWQSREGQMVRTGTVNFSGPQVEGWEGQLLMDAQIPAGLNISDVWKSAKFVYVAPGETVVSAAEERELVEFVKAGGHLFMTADAGRRVVERESDDWCLLRDFGFEPREWDLPGNIRLGGKLPLEERDFGCGRVTVLWASSVVPPGNDASTARVPHFLRSLAAAAGAALPVDCDDRRIAVNLLANDDGTRYLLVCARDGVAVGDCSAKLTLPDGRYRVEQLLGDTPFEPCDMDSAALGGRGIPCGVRANEVRMWRISAK